MEKINLTFSQKASDGKDSLLLEVKKYVSPS